MKEFLHSVFILCIVYFSLSAQELPDYSFRLFPDGNNIPSFKANYQEAKIGILYFTANRNLKVDVGNSVDLFAFDFPRLGATGTVGIDFFAYALSTSFAGNRLQIDALMVSSGEISPLLKKMMMIKSSSG